MGPILIGVVTWLAYRRHVEHKRRSSSFENLEVSSLRAAQRGEMSLGSFDKR
jgi:hypothetical protein